MESKDEDEEILQIKNEIEVTTKTTLNPKVVRAMKNLQASHDENANNIVDHATWEKAMKENFILSIYLATIATVAEDTVPSEDEPQTFNEAWNHSNPKSWKNAKGHSERVQQHEKTSGMKADG